MLSKIAMRTVLDRGVLSVIQQTKIHRDDDGPILQAESRQESAYIPFREDPIPVVLTKGVDSKRSSALEYLMCAVNISDYKVVDRSKVFEINVECWLDYLLPDSSIVGGIDAI